MKKDKEYLLKAESICKKFGERVIVDKVNISIKAGEIITIIGPNGGGKSTLAKILVGILKPDSGKLKYAKKIKIGYMPQKIKINPAIPVNVSYFLKLQSSKDIMNISAETGITHLLNSSIHDLSGGEMQRVMLARALLINPDLLILDEPEQNVDITGQDDIRKILIELNKKHNIAILTISHDLHLVMRSSNHVICLNHHICCEGVPETLSKDQAYLALYSHHHEHKHNICEN